MKVNKKVGSSAAIETIDILLRAIVVECWLIHIAHHDAQSERMKSHIA